MHQSHLELFIFGKLRDVPRSGYDLMRLAQSETGYRPSPGVIYPMLQSLRKKGFVSVTEEGRRRIYRLTVKGAEHIAKAGEEKSALFDQLIREMRMVGKTCADEESVAYLIEFIRRAKRGEDPLGGVAPEAFAFRRTLFKTILDKDFKDKAHKVKKILAHATAELKSL